MGSPYGYFVGVAAVSAWRGKDIEPAQLLFYVVLIASVDWLWRRFMCQPASGGSNLNELEQ